MTDDELKRAIEACRPGSNDINLPEMSALRDAIERDQRVGELYRRTQECDAAISAAFHELPVPEDLAGRLLDTVRQAERTAVENAEPSSEPRNVGVAPHPSRGPLAGRPGSRRRWLQVAVPLAAASLVLLVGVFYFRRTQPEPRADERLRAETGDWRDLILRNGWQEDLTSAVPGSRPPAADIAVQPRRWCQIQTRYDSATVVYDLAGRGRPFAHVYCMRVPMHRSRLPSTPPLMPYRPTGRVSLGVWRRGEMVYVLAVQGDSERYSEFLNSSILFSRTTAAPLSLV
jgi:hypothetical protein